MTLRPRLCLEDSNRLDMRAVLDVEGCLYVNVNDLVSWLELRGYKVPIAEELEAARVELEGP